MINERSKWPFCPLINESMFAIPGSPWSPPPRTQSLPQMSFMLDPSPQHTKQSIDFHRLTMRQTFICLRKWRTCGPVVSKKNDGMILWCPYSSFTDFLCTFVHVVNSISNRFFQILATEVWMKEIATYFHLFLCYSILLKNLKANTPFSQKLFSKEPFTSTRKGSSSNNTKLQWMEVQSLVTNMLFPKTGSQLSIVTI